MASAPSAVPHAGLARMRPRDPRQPHRTASTLELFFDLTFVVAVSVAATELLMAEEHGAAIGVVRYVLVFFAVWWAWVNFTWFASAFDTDDWYYRCLTIVQMGGVLVLASGIPRLAEQQDFTVTVVGYVIMRLAMVAQWLRASRDPAYRRTALRYAGGITLVQIGWIALLLVPPPLSIVLPVPLAALELTVPVWAERTGVTPFHRHHIAERYGLFTLIVLGEGLLSVTTALIKAQSEAGAPLVVIGATALLLLAGMWWIYFSRTPPVLDAAEGPQVFAYGYLHLLVFGSAAALASGIELAIDRLAPEGEGHHAATLLNLGPAVQAATTVPLALFLLSTWFVVLRHRLQGGVALAVPALAVVAGLAALVPAGLPLAVLPVAAAVAVLEVDRQRAARRSAAA